MSNVAFQNFQRKPFPVEAIRVTPLNMQELAEECGGELKHDGQKEGNVSRDYIKVRVAFPLSDEQTKARIGDWLVRQGRSWKVYKDKAFRNTFESPDGSPVEGDKERRDTRKKPDWRPNGNPKNRRKKNVPAKKPEVGTPEETPLNEQTFESTNSTTVPEDRQAIVLDECDSNKVVTGVFRGDS